MQLSAPVESGPADVVVVEGESGAIPFERPSADVIAERVVDGVPWYTFARVGDCVVARFYGLAEFRIEADHRRVVCCRGPATDPGIIPILLAGTVAAYLLSVGGRLVLHASAVEVDGEALIFVGYSGQGKTTMATLLCSEGYPLVTDDVLPIRIAPGSTAVQCVPGGVELRLRPRVEDLLDRFDLAVGRRTTADGRHALAPRLTSAAELPAKAIIVPIPDRMNDRLEAERLSVGAAALTLARFQRIEGWTGSAEVRAQFLTVSSVAELIPVLALRVPWGPPFSKNIGRSVAELASHYGSD